MTLKKLAKEIKNTRKKQRLSLQATAKQLGISYATLWKLENNRCTTLSKRVKNSTLNFILNTSQTNQKLTQEEKTTPIKRSSAFKIPQALNKIDYAQLLINSVTKDLIQLRAQLATTSAEL